MWFLKSIVLVWTVYALTLASTDFRCSKGQRLVVPRSKGTKTCAVCPPGYFQDKETQSQYCNPCSKCTKSRGSEILEPCSAERNTKCQCRENFERIENDSTTCRCPSGFIEHLQDCVKKETRLTKETTSIHVNHFQTSVTTLQPNEGPSTQTTVQDTTTIEETTGQTTRDSHTSEILWGFMVVASLVLMGLICIYILQRMRRRPEQKRNTSFRTPVEESGDGSNDSLKQNQEEP